MKRLSLSLAVLAFGVSACSSTPKYHVLNEKAESSTVDIQIKGKAKIGFLRQIAKKKNAPQCKQIQKNWFHVQIKNQDNGKMEKLVYDCRYKKGYLLVRSKNLVKPGVYQMKYHNRNKSQAEWNGEPKVFAMYAHPDFASETDQISDGAKALASGKAVKDSVSYNDGDWTDWYALKGAVGKVRLSLIDSEPKKRQFYASVYRKSETDSKVKFVTRLKSKRRKTLRIQPGSQYFVRVRSYLFQGKGNYTLLRKDSEGFTGGQLRKLMVFDVFPLEAKKSIALLHKDEGLKIGDQVLVKGTETSGKVSVIGRCLVTAETETQMSCELPLAVQKKYLEYVALAKVSPKS